MSVPALESVLPIGRKVRLYGGLGGIYQVVSARRSYHGHWYRFRGVDFGDSSEGYADLVKQALP